MDVHPLSRRRCAAAIRRIAQYRLRRDLTWAELEAEMTRANLHVSGIRHLLLHGLTRRLPYERTIYKLEQFAKHIAREGDSSGSVAPAQEAARV